MSELIIKRSIGACRRLAPEGGDEALHGFDWAIRTVFAAADCSATAAQGTLDSALAFIQDRQLNRIPGRGKLNQSAENIGRSLSLTTLRNLSAGQAPLILVSVREKQGSLVAYSHKAEGEV